jgi:hypothetical protein
MIPLDKSTILHSFIKIRCLVKKTVLSKRHSQVGKPINLNYLDSDILLGIRPDFEGERGGRETNVNRWWSSRLTQSTILALNDSQLDF